MCSLQWKESRIEMNLRVVSGLMLILLLVSMQYVIFDMPVVVATGIIYIRADDSINPQASAAQVNSEPGQFVAQSSIDWWPMFHHDPEHTGASSSNGPTTNNTIWIYSTGGTGGSAVRYSPAIVDGRVYVWSGDELCCLNASTGALIWHYATYGPVYYSCSPAVWRGIVFVCSGWYWVYALNATTGALRWIYQTYPNYVIQSSSPTVWYGIVFVGGSTPYGANLLALDADRGILLWNYTTGLLEMSSPAVCDQNIVFVGSGHSVYALYATTGALIWSYQTGSWVSSPAVAGNVYVGSGDHKVYALDMFTGSLQWSYQTGAPVDLSSPAVDWRGTVYVGSEDGKVYALHGIYGDALWSYQTGSYVDSSPAVAGGIVYVGSHDGKVYALDEYSGNLVWSYQTGGAVWSSPAVAGGIVYVGSEDGKVYAFGPPPDIAVVSVTPSKTVIAQGYSQSINVTIQNQGFLPETFNVTAYANTTIIETKTNITLTSGDSTTVTFTWNTTGFAKGNYTITAEATQLPGETDTLDNTLEDGWIIVTLVGDINADWKVDIEDIYLSLIHI